jgi:hypothetical protein
VIEHCNEQFGCSLARAQGAVAAVYSTSTRARR